MSLVSHELKTPITSLKITAQALRRKFEKDGDSNTAERLEKMSKQIDRMTNIIADLMDTSRIEHGAIKLQKTKFNFNAFVKEIVEEMQNTSSEHNIVIKEKATCIVFADTFRIGQVLTNLLSNAIRYSPDTVDITVTIDSKENNVLCSVQDFGVGIPLDQQEKIFERFYRVKDIEQWVHMGMGLGLYIAREIIKLHKGKVWVESTPKKGSTFYFTLPTLP